MALLDLSKPKDLYFDTSLRNETIAWLSTVRPDNRPHLVPVWFLWDGEIILVFSRPANQKTRNIAQNPDVVLAVKPPGWESDVVLVEGLATILTPDSGITPLLPAYAAKYNELLRSMQMTPESMATSYSEPIRIIPSKFRSS